MTTKPESWATKLAEKVPGTAAATKKKNKEAEEAKRIAEEEDAKRKAEEAERARENAKIRTKLDKHDEKILGALTAIDAIVERATKEIPIDVDIPNVTVYFTDWRFTDQFTPALADAETMLLKSDKLQNSAVGRGLLTDRDKQRFRGYASRIAQYKDAQKNIKAARLSADLVRASLSSLNETLSPTERTMAATPGKLDSYFNSGAMGEPDSYIFENTRTLLEKRINAYANDVQKIPDKMRIPFTNYLIRSTSTLKTYQPTPTSLASGTHVLGKGKSGETPLCLMCGTRAHFYSGHVGGPLVCGAVCNATLASGAGSRHLAGVPSVNQPTNGNLSSGLSWKPGAGIPPGQSCGRGTARPPVMQCLAAGVTMPLEDAMSDAANIFPDTVDIESPRMTLYRAPGPITASPTYALTTSLDTPLSLSVALDRAQVGTRIILKYVFDMVDDQHVPSHKIQTKLLHRAQTSLEGATAEPLHLEWKEVIFTKSERYLEMAVQLTVTSDQKSTESRAPGSLVSVTFVKGTDKSKYAMLLFPLHIRVSVPKTGKTIEYKHSATSIDYMPWYSAHVRTVSVDPQGKAISERRSMTKPLNKLMREISGSAEVTLVYIITECSSDMAPPERVKSDLVTRAIAGLMEMTDDKLSLHISTSVFKTRKTSRGCHGTLSIKLKRTDFDASRPSRIRLDTEEKQAQ